MPSITDLYTTSASTVFTWSEVSEIHKIRNGIYQRNGRLISLLTDFGRINPCYPDFHGDTTDTIFYTGSGRRGDQKLDAANRALLDAAGTGQAVPLFNKLSVNRWEFTGFWHIREGKYLYDETQNRMVWKFTLARAACDGNGLGDRREIEKRRQARLPNCEQVKWSRQTTLSVDNVDLIQDP
jgi:hypothetical protein